MRELEKTDGNRTWNTIFGYYTTFKVVIDRQHVQWSDLWSLRLDEKFDSIFGIKILMAFIGVGASR